MKNNEPFAISESIAASTDLTYLWRQQPTEEAASWSDDPVYDRLMADMARALHRGRLSHLVLTAERGVELESLITEFAKRAASDSWLPFLRDRRIILVDARFTLPEESRDRLLAVLSSVANDPQLVVCIAGFASLMRGVGDSNRECLLSALGSVNSQLIGLMTPTEFEETLSGDAEAAEYITPFEVPEPQLETALRWLRQYALTLGERHDVQIDEEVVRLAATLSANYILHERLPGKARKILHCICQDIVFDRTQLQNDRPAITCDDVIEAVSASTGIPHDTLKGIAAKQNYEEGLQEFIIGQDHAVREMATELGLIKAGLTDSGKPASVIMFVGQTGTGKTEMAKALARFYSNSKRLRTYTLGNMVEPHSVSAIIGVPPGYVGHDQGGKIVHDLHADPHSVFLLDEADKAHPDVLQPFLNLFDEGWIRDQRGVQAYAENAIFVLTTNVGQRMIADMAKQGKSPDEMATRMKETLAQIKHPKSSRPVFAAEFLARIKRIIVFQPLSREAMLGICQKLVSEMRQQWQDNRNKELEIAEAIVASVAEEAHRRNEKSDGREGGRVVRKLLSDIVDANIQRAIADRPSDYMQSTRVVMQAQVPASVGHDTQEENGDETDRYTTPYQLEISVDFT